MGPIASASIGFQLAFRSLFNSGRGYAFPCDALGRVDMDRMSEKARTNYFAACSKVGQELCTPSIEMVAAQPA
jgi:hypothetical protein